MFFLQSLTKELGDDHFLTQRCRHNLAHALLKQKKFAEAEKMLRDLIPTRVRSQGAEHHDTLSSFILLADALEQQGQWIEGEKILRETLPVARRALGSNHQYTAQCLDSLVVNLLRQQKLAAVEEFARELALFYQRQRGDDDAKTKAMFAVVGQSLLAQRKYPEAIAVLQPLVDKEAPGSQRALAQVLLGEALVANGQAVAAESVLRSCLDHRRRTLPAGDRQIARVESLLGASLTAQKKFSEAEPPLISSYEALQKVKDLPFARLREAHVRVVELYTLWGKPEEVERWQRLAPKEPPAKIPPAPTPNKP